MNPFPNRWLVVTAVLSLAASLATAQVDEPEAWKETAVAPPADWNAERAVEFRLDNSTTLRYAIDPKTIRLDEDGVVRYVFVARSTSGALNAIFEGIRCQTAEVRTHARWDPSARQWRTGNDTWQPLENRGATRRAWQMAQAGLCDGKAPNRSVNRIVDSLRNGRADQMR
jgi:hypothetical protein